MAIPFIRWRSLMLLILFKDLHYFYHISIAVLNQPIKIIRMIIKAFYGLYTQITPGYVFFNFLGRLVQMITEFMRPAPSFAHRLLFDKSPGNK